MRMKHRWTGALLLVAALTLGACAPTDAGGDAESAAPTIEASADAASPTPAPTPTEADEY
jgi:hypothetical protein